MGLFIHGYEEAHANFAEWKAHHPKVYAACKYMLKLAINHALHFGVDAIGATFGDPLLYEEMELVYYGVKLTYQISTALYAYLKSTSHIHQHQIEYLQHLEGTAATVATNAVMYGAGYEVQKSRDCTIS